MLPICTQPISISISLRGCVISCLSLYKSRSRWTEKKNERKTPTRKVRKTQEQWLCFVSCTLRLKTSTPVNTKWWGAILEEKRLFCLFVWGFLFNSLLVKLWTVWALFTLARPSNHVVSRFWTWMAREDLVFQVVFLFFLLFIVGVFLFRIFFRWPFFRVGKSNDLVATAQMVGSGWACIYSEESFLPQS